MRFPHTLLTVVCASLLLTAGTHTMAAEALPAAAQQAFDKGVAAAKESDYLLAIRFFEQARKTAPESPIIWFNLGVSESKLPGRELRAIVWLEASLAARPDDVKAKAIRGEIQALDVRSQSALAKLLKTMRSVAEQIPKPNPWERDLEHNLADIAYEQIALFSAQSGDFEGATRDAEHIQHGRLKANAQAAIVKAQVQAGDLSGAQKTLATARADLRSITRADTKASATAAIASAQEEAGDHAGALDTVRDIQYPGIRNRALATIAKAEADAGQFGAASANANSIEIFFDKLDAQAHMARVQAESGDRVGAGKTLAMAIDTLTKVRHDLNDQGFHSEPAALNMVSVGFNGRPIISPPAAPVSVTELNSQEFNLKYPRKNIFIAQGLIGEFDQHATNQYLETGSSDEPIRDLGIALGRAGNFRGADRLIEYILNSRPSRPNDRERTVCMMMTDIAKIQFSVGDPVGARRNLKSAAARSSAWASAKYRAPVQRAIAEATNGWTAANDYLLNKPIFLDFREYMKSLTEGSLRVRVDFLDLTVQTIIDARQAISQLRKQQVVQTEIKRNG